MANTDRRKLPNYETITIPIYPHLKKFILAEFELTEPVKVEKHSLLGRQIYPLLRSPKRYQVKTDLKESLRVVLSRPMEKFEREGKRSKLALINKYYDKLFKICMYNWVQGQYNAGIPASQAIKNYLSYYQIREEEYSYEAAQRAWLRHRNKK